MEARKEVRRIAANTKKLFMLHNREAGDAAKVAKKPPTLPLRLLAKRTLLIPN